MEPQQRAACLSLILHKSFKLGMAFIVVSTACKQQSRPFKVGLPMRQYVVGSAGFEPATYRV